MSIVSNTAEEVSGFTVVLSTLVAFSSAGETFISPPPRTSLRVLWCFSARLDQLDVFHEWVLPFIFVRDFFFKKSFKRLIS